MSRERVLEAVRAELPPSTDLPTIPADFGVRFDDKSAAFSEMVIAVGGKPIPVESAAEVTPILETELGEHTRWLSFTAHVDGRGVDPDTLPRGHDYHDVDLTVLEGMFGVAENGAIWVPIDRVSHPAALVLSQHLAILVAASSIVDNMHDAYARLAAYEELPSYGVFVSGPSKTADIEQSLVIGAHGARSLRAFIVGN